MMVSAALAISLSLSLPQRLPLPSRPEPQPSRLKHIDRQPPSHVEALLLDAKLVSLGRPPAAAAAALAAPLAAHVDAAAAGAAAAGGARPAALSGRLCTNGGQTGPKTRYLNLLRR